jgi:hypothetical protein
VYTEFWWWNLRGKRAVRRPRIRWWNKIKMDLQEVGWGVWTGSIWLKRGTGGVHLYTL